MTLTSSEVKLVVVVIVVVHGCGAGGWVVVVVGGWIARVLMNPGVPVGVMCVGLDMCVSCKIVVTSWFMDRAMGVRRVPDGRTQEE